MFKYIKKRRKPLFDRKVLRKNDISLLILDERWNALFTSNEKTPEILQCEGMLRELLKEQARLTAENQELAVRKKGAMERIIRLTGDVFERNDAQAKQEMQQAEQEIKRVNERLEEIAAKMESIPDSIRETNLALLEYTVNVVYFKIRSHQKRVEELDKLIEGVRSQLKEYMEERRTLADADTDTYSYFHDLLGGEELEKLDREFFG